MTNSARNFDRRVARVLRGLKPGEVVSYGEVAEAAGFPGAARAVGNVVSKGDGFPWWRVVRADGTLASGHVAKQARLLKAEGVSVVSGKVRSS